METGAVPPESTTVPPEAAAGLDEGGLRRVGAAAARHLGPDLPGLVAVVARGAQVHIEALGSLRVGGAPVDRASLFRISSMSKPITAAATLALVEEGLFTLDEPVDRLLPELAAPRVLRRPDGPLSDTVDAEGPVTARQLLSFTFGFGVAGEMFGAERPWPVVAAAEKLNLATFGPPDPAVQPDPDTWMAALGSLPLIAQPGQRWLYNTGSSVLGVLLARAAGRPLGEVLRTRVFDPLGMTDTAFWTSATDRLAGAYRVDAGGPVEWDPPEGAWSRPPAFGDGAAGLVSGADDLLAFARMLLAGGVPILSPQSVRSMTTDQLTPSQKAYGGLEPDFFADQSWAFGQSVSTTGAYGWDGGLGTSFLVHPRLDLIVIVLTQRMFDGPTSAAVHREIEAAAVDAVSDVSGRVRPGRC